MYPKALTALIFSVALPFSLPAAATVTEDLNAGLSYAQALNNNVNSPEELQAAVDEALLLLCPGLADDNNCLAGAAFLRAAESQNLIPEGSDITQLALATGINPDLVSGATAAGPGGGTVTGGGSFGQSGFGGSVGSGGGTQASDN